MEKTEIQMYKEELVKLRTERDLREYNLVVKCSNVAASYEMDTSHLKGFTDQPLLQLFVRKVSQTICDNIRKLNDQ